MTLGGEDVYLYEPLALEYLAADEETRIRRLMEVYVRWMEERIKLDPGQYLWLHRRWKSRPEGEVN